MNENENIIKLTINQVLPTLLPFTCKICGQTNRFLTKSVKSHVLRQMCNLRGI